MPRVAILVLGMHRSGTSALTRVVSLLGAALPEHLMRPTRANAAGFWEPERLRWLHDQMLTEAGSSWDDWRGFDPTVLGPERLGYYRDAIRSLIVEEYGNARLLVLKDPRICRFVPLHEEVLAELDIEPRFLLGYRNPLAVIESLDRRDSMTEGFASLLWLRHELDAERTTRGKPRAFLSYEALLGDWRATLTRVTEELRIDWPHSPDEVADQIDAHLSRDLQHHPRTFADLAAHSGLAAWIQESYAALQGLGHPGEESEQASASLDRVRGEFEAMVPIFGAATFPELAERRRQYAAKARQMSAETEAKLAAEQATSQEKLAAEQATVTRLGAEASTLRHEIVALRHQLDYVNSSISWRLTAPLRAVLRGLRAVRQPPGQKEGLQEPTESTPEPLGIPPDSEQAAALQLTDEQITHATTIVENAEVGRFSIVMATWNRRDTVGRAIESVLAQSYQDWELILCDDGSEDGTKQYVHRHFAAHVASGQIRYLQLEHRGVSAARNAGLRAADGPWITYLDSDNVWHQHYLLMTVAGYAANPHRRTAYACVHVYDSPARREYIYYEPFDWHRLFTRNFIDLNVFSHHRNLVDELGGFDESLTRLVDWDLILRYTQAHEPQCNPFVLCDYYIDHRLHNISLREPLAANETAVRRKFDATVARDETSPLQTA